MAKVQFSLKPTSKSKRHITVGDCGNGDIIYLENLNAFALIIYTDDENIDYCNNQTVCRKFVGEINFDINDFEEFI